MDMDEMGLLAWEEGQVGDGEGFVWDCVEDLYVCLFMLCIIFIYKWSMYRYPSQFRLHVQSLIELLKNLRLRFTPSTPCSDFWRPTSPLS